MNDISRVEKRLSRALQHPRNHETLIAPGVTHTHLAPH
jgi:hypothetical protein